MIVVTGANGKLGRAVIEALLSRVPADRIVASARDPERAVSFTERGVRVRAGDFARPESLATAFQGACQVLIVSVDRVGEPGRRLHRTAIESARAIGTRRVLYTSHMGTRPDSPLNDHDAAEEILRTSGEPFTSLRHGFYAESALHLIGRGIEDGQISTPEDGPVSWTARADLAEADAIVLADEGRLDGITPALTAPSAFTMADIASIASEVTGRAIRHRTVSDDAWLDARLAEGAPEPMAKLLLAFFQSARRGDFAATDPALESLLGRRPQTIREVLAGILAPAAT